VKKIAELQSTEMKEKLLQETKRRIQKSSITGRAALLSCRAFTCKTDTGKLPQNLPALLITHRASISSPPKRKGPAIN
jgi:hypothetical protein